MKEHTTTDLFQRCRRLGLGICWLIALTLLSCALAPQRMPETVRAAASDCPTSSAPIIGVTGYVVGPDLEIGREIGQYQLNRTYHDALLRAGALPVHLVPVPEADVPALLDRLDGVVLAGGPDIDPALYGETPHPSVSVLDPERQNFDFAVIREALLRRLPVLGICLGSQEINVALGGNMIQDIPSEVADHVEHSPADFEALLRGVHPIEILPNTPLSRIYGQSTMTVNSAHHQAVDQLGEGLVVTARAPDGIIEGFVGPDYPFLLGVQFHPELQQPPELHEPLFRALVQAAVAGRSCQPQTSAEGPQ